MLRTRNGPKESLLDCFSKKIELKVSLSKNKKTLDFGGRPIFFVIRALNMGGSESQLVLTCRELKRRNVGVKVVCFYHGGSLIPKVLQENIEISTVGKKGRWDVASFVNKMLTLMRDDRPILAYGYLGLANILCGLFKILRPEMRVIWGVRASRMDLTYYDWIRRMEKALMRSLAFLPDRIIVNSKAGFSELLRQGYPASKLRLIHNGIDTRGFQPLRQEGRELRAKWGCNKGGQILVGMVARLDPIKDQETFLRAASILLQRENNVRFVCVGPDWGGRSNSLRGMAESLGLTRHLFWEGERNDVASVYNALDVLTLCSISEGFPNVVAEAMACGVPCVVTDVGDCAYIVGDTGRVVPPRDPVALARAWEEMLSLDLGEMGRRARERIVKHFSLDRMVDETIKVFEEVLGRPLERRSAPLDGLEA